MKIVVELDIDADDKYCHHCNHHKAGGNWCHLFNKCLHQCLGGGLLRCDACLKAEQKTAEKGE